MRHRSNGTMFQNRKGGKPAAPARKRHGGTASAPSAALDSADAMAVEPNALPLSFLTESSIHQEAPKSFILARWRTQRFRFRAAANQRGF